MFLIPRMGRSHGFSRAWSALMPSFACRSTRWRSAGHNSFGVRCPGSARSDRADRLLLAVEHGFRQYADTFCRSVASSDST
jgi:hypothetical protein